MGAAGARARLNEYVTKHVTTSLRIGNEPQRRVKRSGFRNPASLVGAW
jgi:hypothetical protein